LNAISGAHDELAGGTVCLTFNSAPGAPCEGRRKQNSELIGNDLVTPESSWTDSWVFRELPDQQWAT
jgi:hypothetical protein